MSLYIDVAEAIIDHLLYYQPFRDFLYVTDIDLPTMKPSHTFEHLSCFLPGMLMLGVHTLSDKLTPEQATKHKWAARGLAKACWLTYADMPSGLGPDEVTMQKEGSLAWVRAYAEWQQKGGEGDAPGSRETEPEPDPYLRNYKVRKPSFCLGLKHWKASTFCGGLGKAMSGKSVLGRSLRQSRPSLGHLRRMPASPMSSIQYWMGDSS